MSWSDTTPSHRPELNRGWKLDQWTLSSDCISPSQFKPRKGVALGENGLQIWLAKFHWLANMSVLFLNTFVSLVIHRISTTPSTLFLKYGLNLGWIPTTGRPHSCVKDSVMIHIVCAWRHESEFVFTSVVARQCKINASTHDLGIKSTFSNRDSSSVKVCGSWQLNEIPLDLSYSTPEFARLFKFCQQKPIIR